jgi:hypothetical protein
MKEGRGGFDCNAVKGVKSLQTSLLLKGGLKVIPRPLEKGGQGWI